VAAGSHGSHVVTFTARRHRRVIGGVPSGSSSSRRDSISPWSAKQRSSPESPARKFPRSLAFPLMVQAPRSARLVPWLAMAALLEFGVIAFLWPNAVLPPAYVLLHTLLYDGGALVAVAVAHATYSWLCHGPTSLEIPMPDAL
jgi:hypothetical protein